MDQAIGQEQFEKILNESTNRPLLDYERKELAAHFAAALASVPYVAPTSDELEARAEALSEEKRAAKKHKGHK